VSGPAAAWWGADAVSLAALYQLTAGTSGGGSSASGTLAELYTTGDFSTCPTWLAPAELPQVATSFDSDGFPLDGAFSNREPDTQLVDEQQAPFVYLWTESAQASEKMDSQATFFEQRLVVLVRVRRNEDSGSTTGGYGVSVAREFARRQALNLCRGVMYLLARDLARTCRTLDPSGGFGVSYALQTESPTSTPNFGADGDSFADATASITVVQLRSDPANTGV
jgi:hypothetical protein